MRLYRDWKNPSWQPFNFKCMYLRSQTRYQRNSNRYTCFSVVLPSIRTHENTMRPNRKWTNSRWRPLNFYCVSLRSQTRYQRNSNGKTYVLEVQHSTGTCGNDVRPNRKWKAKKFSANARLFDLFSGIDTHMITKVLIN